MSGAFDTSLMLRSMTGQIGGNPEYMAIGAPYAGYATPTDMFTLINPLASGKLLCVRAMVLASKSTAATLLTFEWHRRAILNTAGTGTPTDIAAAKYDSRDAAAVGIARLYGSLPTINDANSAANFISTQIALTALITAAPALYAIAGTGLFPTNGNIQDISSPLMILQGQQLSMTLLGAALPAGFTAIPMVQWAEYDLRNAI